MPASPPITESELVADSVLVTLARTGDEAAFATLYQRHQAAARLVAAQYAPRSADVDDLVSEAFARIYRLIRQGKGPDSFFRAYLFTCVRHLAARSGELFARVRPTDDVGELDSQVDHPGSKLEFFERETVQGAFESLPERWQTVLWYVEVEGLPPAQVAPLLGLSPNGVSALAYRAREGLRQAYLQAHATSQIKDECLTISSRLGSYTRNGLAERDKVKVEAHLTDCTECQAVVTELSDVNKTLKSGIGLLVLGPAAVALLPQLATVPPGAAVASVAAVTPAVADAVTPAAVADAAGKAKAASAGTAAGVGTAATGLRALLSRLPSWVPFASNPVVAATAAAVTLVLGTSLVVGATPLFRDPQSSTPQAAVGTPKDLPTLSAGDGAMTAVYVQDGKLGLATAAGSLSAVELGGQGAGKATLDLPHGATVRHAELVWAATNPGKDWWNVTLEGPKGSQKLLANAKSTLGPATLLTADVTDLVEKGGAGTWRISHVDLAKGGPEAWAGWSLTVVVTDPAQTAAQRVTLYVGDLPVASSDQAHQQVAAPDMALTAMHGVVWGGQKNDAATSAWLLDAAGDAALGQGYGVKRATPPKDGVEVLLGGQAYFPIGPGQPNPAVAFRRAKGTGQGQHVGLIGVVAPLPTPGTNQG